VEERATPPLLASVVLYVPDWLLNLYNCLALTCSKEVHDLNAADFEIKSEDVFYLYRFIDGFFQNP